MTNSVFCFFFPFSIDVLVQWMFNILILFTLISYAPPVCDVWTFEGFFVIQASKISRWCCFWSSGRSNDLSDETKLCQFFRSLLSTLSHNLSSNNLLINTQPFEAVRIALVVPHAFLKQGPTFPLLHEWKHCKSIFAKCCYGILYEGTGQCSIW